MKAISPSALPARADVVIIGGGVIGTSAAFHLAEAGRSVVLLERGSLGGGSTARAAGGVRAQFSDAVNIELARRSLELFRDFARRPGGEIDLRQVGYLFVLSTPEDVTAFERSVSLQNELGVPSRILSAAECRQLCPLLAGDDILAGSFSPEDGHATPDAVVQGYAAGARGHGATLLTGCPATAIELAGSEIRAVRCPLGRVATGVVICAAGPWSAECGAMAGLDLPVVPLRRQILFTGPIPALPRELPMTIDFASSFYFHREGPGLLMGMSDPEETPGFKLETSDEWIPRLLTVAGHRAPRVAEAGIRGGWAGLYEMTPDHNAIIGEAREVSRFLYATGFSGHGFLQGPVVGEVLRDLVLGQPPPVDVTPLSAERFGLARLRPEFNVV